MFTIWKNILYIKVYVFRLMHMWLHQHGLQSIFLIVHNLVHKNSDTAYFHF